MPMPDIIEDGSDEMPSTRVAPILFVLPFIGPVTLFAGDHVRAFYAGAVSFGICVGLSVALWRTYQRAHGELEDRLSHEAGMRHTESMMHTVDSQKAGETVRAAKMEAARLRAENRVLVDMVSRMRVERVEKGGA